MTKTLAQELDDETWGKDATEAGSAEVPSYGALVADMEAEIHDAKMRVIAAKNVWLRRVAKAELKAFETALKHISQLAP